MKSNFNLPSLTLLAFVLTGCGQKLDATPLISTTGLTPVDTQSPADLSVVHGRALVNVTSDQRSALAKALKNIFLSHAYAASGSTPVTYTNGTSTTFTINVNAFTPGTMTFNTLSLGSVALSGLSDNNLKVCGTNANLKCTSAVIRVYTTGSMAGFVNTADAYSAPVFTGSLNPSTPVGLLAAGSVQVQTLSLPPNKHTVSISDFPTPTYTVSADFSNAGAGSYAMTYVVEYVLLP